MAAAEHGCDAQTAVTLEGFNGRPGRRWFRGPVCGRTAERPPRSGLLLDGFAGEGAVSAVVGFTHDGLLFPQERAPIGVLLRDRNCRDAVCWRWYERGDATLLGQRPVVAQRCGLLRHGPHSEGARV